MSSRRLLLAIAVLATAAVAAVATTPSGATFTDGSSTDATVTAANDWTPPTVSVNAPAQASGTVTVTATASDQRSAVASVRIEVSSGSGWTTLCTRTDAPYSCDWNTTSLADGTHQVRATATDTVGLTAVSAVVSTQVSNSGRVVLSPVPTILRGTVELTATFDRIVLQPWTGLQYAEAGSGSWKDVCAYSLQNPRVCTWDTRGVPSGYYDVRARSTFLLSSHADVQTGVLVDNTAPTGSLILPAGPLSGVVQLGANAADAHSGVASVTFQHRPVGGTWQDCGVATSTPYSCSFDTTQRPNVEWEFRARIVDKAGNELVTPVQKRVISNVVSTVSITSHKDGDVINRRTTVTAAASSTKPITQVRIEFRSANGSWSTVCTSTVAPYSCSWDTQTVSAGAHELRAVLTDATGATITSTAVTVTVTKGNG